MGENDEVIADIDTFMKYINVLKEQNKELDLEIDRFLACDNEIRNKLIDRERSPLRLCDLYEGPATRQFRINNGYQEEQLQNPREVVSHQKIISEVPSLD